MATDDTNMMTNGQNGPILTKRSKMVKRVTKVKTFRNAQKTQNGKN